MKKGFALLVMVLAGNAFGISMNFHGNFRAETSYYGKLDLTQNGSTKSFIGARALLNPDLLIDDHFSIRSQWSLLTSPTFTPNATVPLGLGQGGYIFGDVQTSALNLNRVWLEWTSDFGVFRLGRMPIAWGYGLIWDAGNRIWDDFQTTFDRLEYRLHLGYITGALAYSKARKLSTLSNTNDQEFYTIYLRYNNPELDVEGGIYFEKQERSLNQSADLMGVTQGGGVNANPYGLPASHPNPYPLATKTPYPRSNNVVDVYLKKTVGYFTFGGEVGWMTGEATDYNGDGTRDELNALGAVVSVSYTYHKVKAFVEFLYAGGDSNLNDNQLNGFVLLHRNRRPGLILGRELLGPYASSHVAYGSPVVYGDQDTFSGVIYTRPGFRVDWSRNWASGIELIYAQKAASGGSNTLGVELDVGTEYSVYRNFDMGLTMGYLFPGAGLRVTNPKGVFAARFTAGITF